MNKRPTVKLEHLLREQKDRKGIIFVVSAPSGTGKTSVCRGVVKVCENVVNSVSFTTRPFRPGERHGVDYSFITEEEFDCKLRGGEFAEWAVVHGYKYGTPLKALEAVIAEGKDVTLAIDTQGARQIRKRFSNAVLVFLIPPSLEELRRRVAARGGDSKEGVAKRLEAATEELQHSVDYDYILVNRDLDGTIDELRCIIIAERSKVNHTFGRWG